MGCTVDVGGGRVRGRRAEGVVEFLGIPYARPPVGPLRWRPPQPPEPWPGVRDVVEPGPLAPQGPASPVTSLHGEPLHQSEDCLHLSIWTPDADAARRPVMVWLHGGRFVSGTSGSVLTRGGALARAGDVVVVAVNYRLGALGFLAHPALGDGAGPFGNWGLMDQIAALGWVRRWIAGFGGDPGNVTLFGQSAGSMSASTLLGMPGARGKFDRVILQSGPPYTQAVARAARTAGALARELGLPGVDRERLERVPAPDLVDAVGALAERPTPAGELPQPLLPVVDGHSLPLDPVDAVVRGAGAAVPAMIGTNRDEASYFELAERRAEEMDDDEARRLIGHAAPRVDPQFALASYRAALQGRGEPATPRDVWLAAASDLVFRWPAIRLADALARRGAPTFVYLFTWASPAFDGRLGACHGIELPFVFGAVDHPEVAAFAGAGPAAAALSDAVQASWSAFARQGDPSNPRTGPWPAWDARRRETMELGRTCAPVAAPRDDELAVWAAMLPPIGPPWPAATAPSETVRTDAPEAVASSVVTETSTRLS